MKKIQAFFPFQLLLDYVLYKRLILLSWLLPFLFITNSLGIKYGIPLLYLTPEYLEKVNVLPFLFTGLATGSFIMAFHIASYVAMAHHYPFIVRFSKPFYRYCINNSIIPILYISIYIIQSYRYQTTYELLPVSSISLNLTAYLSGVIIFVFFSFGFFKIIVRGIPKLLKRPKPFFLKKISEKDINDKLQESPLDNVEKFKVEYYLSSFFKISRTGRFSHYNKQAFKKVFLNQHLHALYYAIFILALILVRGLVKDEPVLILPAGASFQIIFTVIILFISLLYAILRKWTVVVVSLLLMSIIYLSPQKIMSYNNSAYGINYSNRKSQIDVFDHGDYNKDSLSTIKILERWKIKNSNPYFPRRKPKMVIVTTSGGGLKMAVWTYYTLGYVDSIMQGQLMKHTQLITGASGGMLGAAYLRENYLESMYGTDLEYFSRKKVDLLSQDILNPILFTFSTSDWFFRLQSFSYNHHTYFKDRAYIFEQALNWNLGPVFDKSLFSYQKPEEEAIIPMMILTPAIENVGSRLIISSTNVSYFTKTLENSEIRNIEFRHNYSAFDPDSLRFLSAIRMNASFPMISPDVALPGNPQIYLMDAGLNDNNGIITAYQFISIFKTWIEKNTSGVLLIRLEEKTDIDYHNNSNAINGLLRPISSLFSDWFYIQEVNYLSVINFLYKMLPGKFETMRFSFGDSERKISLSWHLTKSEKKLLLNSINSPENLDNIVRLNSILNDSTLVL